MYLSINQSIYLSIYPSIYLSLSLSISLYFRAYLGPIDYLVAGVAKNHCSDERLTQLRFFLDWMFFDLRLLVCPKMGSKCLNKETLTWCSLNHWSKWRFLKMDDPKVTMGFNTKSWSNDLDDSGITPMTLESSKWLCCVPGSRYAQLRHRNQPWDPHQVPPGTPRTGLTRILG